ncbi:hypothetical protein KBZ15_12720 [Cyanobium sp. BA20m-p-22]|nr:hypothetical protein [Cyanobium sp. BA20m-p-22]
MRLSQFQPGLAAAGIDLQIQSLLDNAYLQRSFNGRRPSLQGLLAAYGRRLQALRQADRFDLAIVYAELLPFLYDCDDAFFLKYRSGRHASTSVLWLERQRLGVGRVWLFDIQGWITLFIGGLLALITFFSAYSHVSIPFGGTAQINQQIGVLLLAALVPALLGDVELATRRRLRAERDRVRSERNRIQAENAAAAERRRAASERRRAAEDRTTAAADRARAEDEAARERDRAARRAQLQNRYALFQLQHQLEPTPEHIRQLRGLIGFLLEYGEFA